MRKQLPKALAASLLLLAPLLDAQQPASGKKPASQAGGVSVHSGSTTEPPPGSKPAEIQDLRILAGEAGATDPYQLERLGNAAAQANELGRARSLFEESWKAGELPTAPYNLACIDVREKKLDAAWKHLDKAVVAGFDDEKTLLSDPDMAPLRDNPIFQNVLAAARTNRAKGDAAVVSEGLFVPPPQKPSGVLLLLHDAASDPLSVSSPFTNEAHARGLFVATPRGPAKSGKKRFGWGSAERALAAVDAALEEAKRRAGASLPVYVLGVGRGGTLAYAVAAKKAGAFAGVGSIGGPFDGGGPAAGLSSVAGLRGIPLFLGVARDVNPQLKTAIHNGQEALGRYGLTPRYAEWPGTGPVFPNDVRAAVKAALDAFKR